MRKIDFFIGIVLGFTATTIGSFLFITLLTDYSFIMGIEALKIQGELGKLIALGAILNIGLVFLSFKKNKDMLAKGIIFSLFLVTLVTLFA